MTYFDAYYYWDTTKRPKGWTKVLGPRNLPRYGYRFYTLSKAQVFLRTMKRKYQAVFIIDQIVRSDGEKMPLRGEP